MTRSRRSWLAPTLMAVTLLAMGAWFLRGPIAGLLGMGGEPVEVSPEAAALAEEKIQRLRDDGEPARLSEVELSSLLRYRSPVWLSERVHDPSVAMAGDTFRVSGKIATEELPSHPDLDRVRILLPDSSEVDVVGQVAGLPSGRVALEIQRVEFAGIPIPERYYPDVLQRFGRQDEPGLDPNALAIPLPQGVGGARVEGGYLILTP